MGSSLTGKSLLRAATTVEANARPDRTISPVIKNRAPLAAKLRITAFPQAKS
jgi:hypothetical protein